MVATGQVSSTGMVALSYVQKVSEKVSLASDFMYNYMSRDVTASVGYDYILGQCRLRGKIDSNGCTSAFLEERLQMGLNFILSAEASTINVDVSMDHEVPHQTMKSSIEEQQWVSTHARNCCT